MKGYGPTKRNRNTQALEILAMKHLEILSDIHALEEDLLGFERKYGLRSETFYPAYMNGEEPEDDRWTLDFGEWASVYRTWLARQAEYRNEIQKPVGWADEGGPTFPPVRRLPACSGFDSRARSRN
ncbi:hypothetical protein [uncultured Lamprocystis sp.]|jgi:hypothetical protein|uniref:hypothetical protein n=1 Tax=uncultured Lamprocystis sp. TaxID=543132 RepID=UPI0025CDEEB0|nr:hypothetical protein [uncultured Lamprocystis sp.]